MNALRKLLSIPLLILTALFGAAAGLTTVHKLGNTPQIPHLEPWLPKMAAAPWWLVGVVGAAALFWLVSASSLLRGTRQAFLPYVVALVATAAAWVFACQLPNHGYGFVPAERLCDIAIAAGFLVLGALVSLTDRRKRYKAEPASE